VQAPAGPKTSEGKSAEDASVPDTDLEVAIRGKFYHYTDQLVKK
jgi:hypothetical protein